MLASAIDPYFQPITTLVLSVSELLKFGCYTFISAVTISIILLIWNQTNAFVEYARLIGFSFSSYKDDEKLGILYIDHLEVKYGDYFIVRLLACPMCLSVWLSFAGYFIHESIWAAVCGMYFSLVFYFFLKIIMNKSDE